MLKKTNCLSIAAVMLCGNAAQANDQLEELIVVSSRIKMPTRQVGTSVSVVSGEELDIRGFDGLANALRYEPGISVTNNGGAGKTTNLRIRGEQSFRTKVFIDGIEVTETSTPQAGPNFAHIGRSGIERVEILRGPQGMMYGADAGGVVAISTVSPAAGLAGNVSAEGGRYGTSEFQGSLAGGNELLDFAVTASQFDTDGFNAQVSDTDPGDDDGYENTTVHARAGWNITEQLRLEGVARNVDADNDYDDCFEAVTFDPTNDCSNDYEQDAWRIALDYGTESFDNTLSYNYSSSDRDFRSAGVSTFAAEGDLEEFAYLGSWRQRDELQLVYGAELRTESIDDGSVDTDRDQSGYFLEYQGGFSDSLFLTAGARYDDNDDFGSETTYRLSAAYLMPFAQGEIKFRSAYGTGFRAPSLFEISYNNGASAFPPASQTQLSAEKSEGYELGVSYFATAGWMAELVYFDQTIEDEIEFDVADFSGYLQGSGDSQSEGIEFVAEIPLGDMLALTGNYTYNDAEDATGERRRRAPKHLGNVGVRVTPWEGKLIVNLNLRISNDTPDEEGVSVDDYEVLDLSARYQLLDQLEIFGRVENLTDENYEEIPNFKTSGAAGYAGVRYSF